MCVKRLEFLRNMDLSILELSVVPAPAILVTGMVLVTEMVLVTGMVLAILTE
jgi:hypothetical protein